MALGGILGQFGLHFGDFGEAFGAKTEPGRENSTPRAPDAKGSISVHPFFAKKSPKWSPDGGPKSYKIDKKAMPRGIQILPPCRNVFLAFFFSWVLESLSSILGGKTEGK